MFACNFPLSFRLPKRTEPQAGYSHDGRRKKNGGTYGKKREAGVGQTQVAPAPAERPATSDPATDRRRITHGKAAHMAHSTSRLGLSRSRSAPARRAPVACAPPVVRVAGVLSLLGGWRWPPGGGSPPPPSSERRGKKANDSCSNCVLRGRALRWAGGARPSKVPAGKVGIMIR